ncbi:MAG TPA: bifunctional nuclease domain-containing protein [Candidatus Nitrosopolaris sp.]|nr:bifunctional nuclease domain-containing protein [Candidatus Nitrosopolaris sp.]
MRAAALALAALAGRALAGSVEVEVRGMGIDPSSGTPVVRLVEKAKAGRELAIWIGPFEAQAIAMELEGVAAPRPLTHDLMKALVERLGAKLDRVVIEDLRENTFFATLHLTGPGGGDLVLDARPSDAIALALRLHGPIVVVEEVFAKATAAHPEPAAVRLWGLTVQDLTPELATFFELPAQPGVLVSDVAAGGPAHEVTRGDLITALDGEPIRSVGQLQERAQAHTGTEPVHLSLRRGRRQLVVTFVAD